MSAEVFLTAHLVLYALLWALPMAFLVSSRARAGLARRPMPPRPWLMATLILLLAAAWRLGWPTEPTLSDDYWRYVHDGQTLAAGENPYARAPADLPDADPRINHPHLVTIYQPLSQYVFAGLTLAKIELRLGFALLDVAVVGLLLLGLHLRGMSPWWAALYAIHPLPASEIGWSGHQDVLGILPLVACVILTGEVLKRRASTTPAPGSGGHCPAPAGQCDEPIDVHVSRASAERSHGPPQGEQWRPGGGHPRRACLVFAAAAGAMLALSIAVKPIVAPLALPLAVMVWRVRPAGVPAAVGACIAMLAALYLPFTLMPGGLDGMIDTARTFTGQWAWNGSMHALVQSLLGSKRVADVTCGLLLLTALIAITRRARDPAAAAMAYLFAALLLSSTVHPWYLLWPLALLPLCPRSWIAPALWVWSLTIAWSYAAFLNPEGFHPPTWVVWLEYLPVFAVLAWSRLRLSRAPDGGPG